MNFNFELILFYAVIVFGVIALIDMIFFATKRKEKYAAKGITNPEEMKLPLLADWGYSFFPILLIVFLLRSFLFEPFRIPTGSLEPTVQIGDFIIVNKFAYGIRLPVLHTKIFNIAEPKRGDIFVFRYPLNPSINYIKRVIGLPGDHIQYINKELTVNGQKMPQTFVQNTVWQDEHGNKQDVVQKEETFFGIKHAIYQVADESGSDFNDIIVPPGMYFAMGDNRDDSADSRAWGYVPEDNVVGKAEVTWLSWDPNNDRVRWQRIGKMVR